MRRVPASDPMLCVLDRACFPHDVPCTFQRAVWWMIDDVAFGGARIIPGDCVYLCRAGVVPSARGQHLHHRLIRVRTSMARALGLPAITYTTHANVVSSNNLIECGYKLWTPARAWAGRDMLYWWNE